MANLLRPNNFDEFKGKQDVKNKLKIYIDSAIQKQESLDHCLFYGLPGTGKTSLAHLIANELKTKIKILQGPTIQKTIDIINPILSLNPNDILFIDEIHAINHQCVEMLYSIMEDYALDINIGKDFNSKITRIKVPNFTLIGATTMLGKIPSPLEERFGILINLEMYNEKEICQIISSSCSKIGVKLNKDEIKEVASNSKGIPRNANRILKRVADYRMQLPEMDIKTILKHIGIIFEGLEEMDIKYLQKIKDFNQPVGIKTLSQILNLDMETIQLKIEPYVLFKNLIVKTSKGREITNKGKDILKQLK